MVDKTDQRIAKLLLAIGPGKMPRRALMADMNLKGRRNFRVNYLIPAMDKGYVRFLFAEAPNSPEQAYFLTKEGMAILHTLKEE
jgi:hypothetical protein